MSKRGRPKVGRKTTVRTITVDKEVWKKATEEFAKRGMKFSTFVTLKLREFLEECHK